MKMNHHYAFILVSDQKNWNRLCQRSSAGRETHAFVRKNLVAPIKAQKLLFYIKKPAKQIRGTADFMERLTGVTDDLWTKYGAESCFENLDEYQTFADGRQRMTFVRFKNLRVLSNPQPPEITMSILGSLRWFRGKYVDEKTAKQLTV
jgi:predicted transcriptional regulator